MPTPAQPVCPLPNANSEGWGFLQINQESIPHPGVDFNISLGRVDDDLGKPVVSPLEATVVAVIPKLLYSWGRLLVLRSVLPRDIVSAGANIPKGTVIYLRYGHLHSIEVRRGQVLAAGARVGTCGGTNGLAPGPYKVSGDTNGAWNPHLHFDIRNGGPSGLPAWDAGDEHAVQEWPSVASYGYPPIHSGTMLRTVALRFIDPVEAIPAAKMPNAYRNAVRFA